MAPGLVDFLGKTCAFDEETHLRRSIDQRSFFWLFCSRQPSVDNISGRWHQWIEVALFVRRASNGARCISPHPTRSARLRRR